MTILAHNILTASNSADTRQEIGEAIAVEARYKSKANYRDVTLWSLEFCFLKGFKPGDLVSVVAIPPKKMKPEELLTNNLGYHKRDKDSGEFILNTKGDRIVVPSSITGYLKLRHDGYSFVRQMRDDAEPGKWRDNPKFREYFDGHQELSRLNSEGRGIYVRVNNCNGQHRDVDAVSCKNLFFECDDISKEEQWGKVEELRSKGFAPLTVLETKKSLHIYYGLEETGVPGWREYQQRLIQRESSDDSIQNEARLMRLPGFDHCSYDEKSQTIQKVKIKIQEFNPKAIYSRDQFDKILPPWDAERWDKTKSSRTKSSHTPAWDINNFSSTFKTKGQRKETFWDDIIPIRSPGDMRNLAPYQVGYAQGRNNALTFKCPCGTGESEDSCHVSISSGCWKSHHKGCSRKDIYEAALRTALLNGYKFKPENSDRPDSKESTLEQKVAEAAESNKLDWYNSKVEAEQKYLNSVDIKPNWTILKTTTKYFFDEIEHLIPKGKPGLILCNMGMSRGKSTKNKTIVRDRPDVPVLGISSTISLQRMQAKDMELVAGSDVERIYEQGVLLTKSEHIQILKRVSLCPPSLWRLISYSRSGEVSSWFDKADGIILLDEFRTALNFLLQSSLSNKDGKRPENIAALKWLLDGAVANNLLVLCDDANLTNIEIDFLAEICPDIPVYWVESSYKEPPKTYNFYVQVIDEDKNEDDEEQLSKNLDKAQFFVDLVEALGKGEPLLFPCDSVKLNAALEQKLKALGFQGDRVDADTNERPEVQRYLNENINRVIAERQPQFVLYSPTLGQSISIEVTEQYMAAVQEILEMERDKAAPEAIAIAEKRAAILANDWTSGTAYFKAKYCINLHLGSSEFDQMMGRDRHCIPTYIYSSESRFPSAHSTAPLSQVQLNTLAQHAEDFGEILEMAKLEIQREADERKQKAIAENDQEYLNLLDFEDFENGIDSNSQILERSKRILRQAREGFYPELTACARQRARSAFEQKDRRQSLKRHLQSKGNVIVDIEVIKADEAIKEELQAIKKQQAYADAQREVNAPLLTKEQADAFKQKPGNTLAERDQLARYYFENDFPTLLSSFDNPVDFYYRTVKEDQRRYLNSVKIHWGFINRQVLKNQDLFSLEFLHQEFDKTGCASFQDLRKMPTAMFKFLESWKIFEVIEKDEVSRHDLEMLLKFVEKGKPRSQLKAYFDTQPPSPDKKLLPWLNRILGRFSLKLSVIRRESDARYYKLIAQIPEELPENAREKIMSVLDSKLASKSSPEHVSAVSIPVPEYNTTKTRTVTDLSRTTNDKKDDDVVQKPLFEIGQDVEGIIDGELSIGLVMHRHFSEYDSQWCYKVELSDDSQVYMLEYMLTRVNHDEVPHPDVLTVVDEAIKSGALILTSTKESSWVQRFEAALKLGKAIAEDLYLSYFEEVEAVWEKLTEVTKQFYLALFAEEPASAIGAHL